MMKLSLSIVFLFLSSLLHAQDFTYQDPVLLWQGLTSDTSAGVYEGNGVYVSPDGSMIVSTSADGTLRAFEPVTGAVMWTFVPENLGFAIRCWSGVTFNFRGDTPYMVYAVADGAIEKENSPLAETYVYLDLSSFSRLPLALSHQHLLVLSYYCSRIIAVDTMGMQIFQSTPLPGIAAGTPVTNKFGDHILVTHNVDRLEGYLSVFLVSNVQAGAPLAPVFSEKYGSLESGANGTANVERPFSPIGYYHSPVGGWYDGGSDNVNDIFFFAWDTSNNASSIEETDGQVFVFQFPLNYTNDGQGLGFVPMGSRTDFHAMTAPVLTNKGLSMYWAVTKATTDCYLGTEGLDRTFFSRGRTGRATFDRAVKPFPAYQSPRASPTLSSDPVMPMVYGVGASNQIWSMDYNYATQNVAATADIISARLMITQDDQYLLYATQAVLSTEAGIYMVPTDNLGQVEWTVNITGGVYGDIALNKRGTVVYAADIIGQISAYQFGDNQMPTATPTIAPTRVSVSTPPGTTTTPGTATVVPTASMGPTITAYPTSVESDVTTMVPTAAISGGATTAPGPTTTETGTTSAPTVALAPGTTRAPAAATPVLPPVLEPTSSSASSVTLIFGVALSLLAFLL